jgi:hypothetical protein
MVNGYFDTLPPEHIPFSKGDKPIVEVEQGQLNAIHWTINPGVPQQGLLTSADSGLLQILDLSRLPISIREELALLLLLPFGLLVTVVLRQIVGVRTFGTFSPTLLALAAIFIDGITALIAFTLVTVLGVLGSSAALPKVALSRVPRLSIIFTLVALTMAFVASLLGYITPQPEESLILLPIVILTTLVDNIYSTLDEHGLKIVLYRLLWTGIAFLGALFILLQNVIGDWLLIYPEIHAWTIAFILAVGHYSHKRLVDFSWFAWMKEPAQPKNTQTGAG